MSNFGPVKEKEQTWPFSPLMRPENIATHTAALLAFSLLFHWQIVLRKVEVIHRSVSSSAILITLRFADRHTDSIYSESSSTQVGLAFFQH